MVRNGKRESNGAGKEKRDEGQTRVIVSRIVSRMKVEAVNKPRLIVED